MIPALLLTVHAAATLYMTGLIWFVQVIHYPLYARVGAGSFVDYQRGHLQATTWVIVPPMLIEAAATVMLLLVPDTIVPRWAAWAGLGLLGVVWLSTFLLAVPQHAVLERGFDPAAWSRLVSTNWFRTVAWSLRSALAIWIVTRLLARSV